MGVRSGIDVIVFPQSTKLNPECLPTICTVLELDGFSSRPQNAVKPSERQGRNLEVYNHPKLTTMTDTDEVR